MKFLSIFLIIFFNLIYFVSNQVVRKGTCPNLPILVNFKPNEYMGIWYEAKRYKNYFQRGCDCAWSLYKMHNNGTITVNTWMKQLQKVKNWSIQWKAKVRSPNTKPMPGQLNIFTSEKPYKFIYSILDTDYKSYSVVWNCYPIANFTYVEHAWVLYRKFPLDKEAQIKVDEILENYLDPKEFRDTEIAYNECWDPDVVSKFEVSDDTDDDICEPTTVETITDADGVIANEGQSNNDQKVETFNPKFTPDVNPFEFFNFDDNNEPKGTELANIEEVNIFTELFEDIQVLIEQETTTVDEAFIEDPNNNPISEINNHNHAPHHKKESDIL